MADHLKLSSFTLNRSNKALDTADATRCASNFVMVKTVQEIISPAPGSRG